ncbi:hypothetical protein KC976_04395 [Candidatus Saccharibacteria bacterium]|nr:hypothetical protein [Candidatus Saccharibacteria bacterium]
MDYAARAKTREAAVQALEKHILDVSQGRVRFGWHPDQVDEYLQQEYRRLREMKGQG